MARRDFDRWIAGYERAWRSAGTDLLSELFAPQATYRPAPFDEPLRGLDAIAEFWEAERAGPDEAFSLTHEIVAVDGQVGVVRVCVAYGDPASKTYRDLWIVTLDSLQRCSAFEEWPFFPDRAPVAPASER